jgi:CRP-like cAMP-binding protein
MALTRDKSEALTAIALFERIAGADLPETSRIAQAVRICRVAPGETVFHQDDAQPFLFIVAEGLVKLVYLQPDGKEWIKSFVAEGQFFASVAALAPAGRASFSAVAVEACRLERIPFALLADLADRDLGWSRLLRRALMLFAERKERRERQLLTLTPEDRYRALLAEAGHLLPRVPQKDLASYLGITPVGLSRIARRVRMQVGSGDDRRLRKAAG